MIPQSIFMGGMGGGCYGFHQHQPPVIIINGDADDHKPDDAKKPSPPPSPPSPPPPPPPNRPLHPACIASIIFFIIASILGFICVAKIYNVFQNSMKNNYYDEGDEEKSLDEHILDYLVVHRTVALGMGAASILMFCIAFMLAFYTGMLYRLKASESSNDKRKTCCLGGLLIAAWIFFCLTFINGLIILVLAFDEGARIYPEVALTAVLGNMAAWICMFGYSQLARVS
jgi:hypothetical protein